jgi:SCP-2 sterol transfer family protein
MAGPGYPVTLTVSASLRELVDVLMQHTTLDSALRRGAIELEGDRELVRRFGDLFDVSAPKSFTRDPASPPLAAPGTPLP